MKLSDEIEARLADLIQLADSSDGWGGFEFVRPEDVRALIADALDTERAAMCNRLSHLAALNDTEHERHFISGLELAYDEVHERIGRERQEEGK